jgi:diguanylate cyclase (GGDEF)-like protein/PAS domain S-box-containing protein
MNNKASPVKILIVDDVAANISLLREFLQGDEYDISAAHDGERAIKIATHTIPDLILLDIMMPGIDGFETCRQLKENAKTENIPVIFVSAKNDMENLLLGFSVGAVDYINKPFHQEEVIARINSQLKIQKLNKRLESSEKKMRSLMLKYQTQSQRLEKIVQSVVDGILETNASGKIQLINPAIERLFGYKSDELIAHCFTQLLADPYATQFDKLLQDIRHRQYTGDVMIEIKGKHKNGLEFPIEFSFIQLSAEEESYLAVIRDNTIHKNREQHLKNLSYIDPLTKLPNRRSFDESFTKEWLQCQRSNKAIAFIMIDVDNFKLYNDTYGHQGGDECLIQVAKTIKNTIKRPSDIVARIGGEEFAIILPDTSHEGVIQIARKLREAVEELSIPHRSSSLGIVTISLGIAISHNDGKCNTPNMLYQMADQALYHAKEAGKNQFFVF